MWHWFRRARSHAELRTVTGWWLFSWLFICWSPTSCLSTCSSPCSGKEHRDEISSSVWQHGHTDPLLLLCLPSHTFSQVQANSDIYWKFQRYNLIVQYHSRPALAPPFIILSHINLFIKRNIRKVPSVKIHHFGQYLIRIQLVLSDVMF